MFSDHTPALVYLDCSSPKAGTKAFKFFNYLVTHPDFQETVTAGWEISSPEAWTLSSLSKKLKKIKEVPENSKQKQFLGYSKEGQ